MQEPSSQEKSGDRAGAGRLVAARVSAALGRRHLSPAHRRIASHLAANAPHSLFLTSPALAAEVGVSQPSVTRFARAAGFAGYGDLQRRLRAIALEETPAASPPSRLNAFQAGVGAAIGTLHTLEAAMAQPEVIREVGAELARSVPLVVLSVRDTAPVANYFAHFAARIHPDVRLLNAGGSLVFDGLTQARQTGARAAICFLMPRHPHEVLTALRYTREQGLRVIVVTDRPGHEVDRLSDLVLVAAVGTGLLFETYAAPMVAAGLILHAMGEANPRRARRRLAEHEEMLILQRVFPPAELAGR